MRASQIALRGLTGCSAQGRRKTARRVREGNDESAEEGGEEEKEGGERVLAIISHIYCIELTVNLRRSKKGAGASTQSTLPEELSVLSPQAQQSVRNTDQMLDQLSGQLKDIKGMALVMGNELEVQNERLDSINASSAKVDARLKATNLKVQKQL